MKTEIKENRKLDLTGYAFSHQCYAFRPVFSQVYKSDLLRAIHLKSDDITFLQQYLIHILLVVLLKEEKKKISTSTIEVIVNCINIYFLGKI